ncbi:MAG: ABC transporter ATP-binding protein [Chloroflexi bacterium]|nr:ABC transporter ATP-binding protein [Chloroflexota bacterium]
MISKNTDLGEISQSDIVISVSNVSKTYKLYPSHQDRLKEALHPFRKRYHQEFSALDGVTFDIRRGESVGILGRNGAGKSTLLQMLAGVLSPSSGTVKVNGKVAALLELGAGFNPDLTGRENVILFSTIQGVAEKDIPERVAAIEAFADVGVFFDQPMKVYSSGMYARVAFGNAIHVNPDVLIVDEILGVGDAKFQEKCYNKIRALRDKGVCILFVSHSTEVVQRNCQKALLLERGKVMAQGVSDIVVAAYHDLLYGSGGSVPQEISASSDLSDKVVSTHSVGQRHEEQLTNFLQNDGEPLSHHFAYYNPNERRFGNGDAEIVDFFVVADESPNFTILNGNGILTIYVKVHFKKDILDPQIGWGIVSPEGIMVSGSNTVSRNSGLLPAKAGEVWVYKISIQTSLCGGDFFINIGACSFDGESWTFFDNRRSVIHFIVAKTERSGGFVDFPSSCSILSSPINL